MPDRYRVLVTVEPPVLGDTFRHLLDQAGQDEVVVLDDGAVAALDADFDVVVTSRPLPTGVRAPLVIQLPDAEGGGGASLVIDLTGTSPVVLSGVDEIIDLLDTRCVGAERRASRLGLPDRPLNSGSGLD